jgi:hypothetical protein
VGENDHFMKCPQSNNSVLTEFEKKCQNQDYKRKPFSISNLIDVTLMDSSLDVRMCVGGVAKYAEQGRGCIQGNSTADRAVVKVAITNKSK